MLIKFSYLDLWGGGAEIIFYSFQTNGIFQKAIYIKSGWLHKTFSQLWYRSCQSRDIQSLVKMDQQVSRVRKRIQPLARTP